MDATPSTVAPAAPAAPTSAPQTSPLQEVCIERTEPVWLINHRNHRGSLTLGPGSPNAPGSLGPWPRRPRARSSRRPRPSAGLAGAHCRIAAKGQRAEWHQHVLGGGGDDRHIGRRGARVRTHAAHPRQTPVLCDPAHLWTAQPADGPVCASGRPLLPRRQSLPPRKRDARGKARRRRTARPAPAGPSSGAGRRRASCGRRSPRW